MIDESYNYWDYISTLEHLSYDDKEGLDALFRDCFYFVRPYLLDLNWVECNLIYLNIIQEVSQRKIMGYFGCSQYAVSTRIHKGLLRLRIRLSKPEVNEYQIHKDFNLLFPNPQDKLKALAYYKFNSYQVNYFIFDRKSDIRDIIRLIQQTEHHDLRDKYLKYFETIKEYHSSGEGIFKNEDIRTIMKW